MTMFMIQQAAEEGCCIYCGVYRHQHRHQHRTAEYSYGQPCTSSSVSMSQNRYLTSHKLTEHICTYMSRGLSSSISTAGFLVDASSLDPPPPTSSEIRSKAGLRKVSSSEDELLKQRKKCVNRTEQVINTEGGSYDQRALNYGRWAPFVSTALKKLP